MPWTIPAMNHMARRLCAALLVVLLPGCALMQSALPVPEDFPVHGIDVSYFQGTVDWDAVRAGGVQFAWIKATEGGDREDPSFVRNWAEAERAGVLRGAYHFYYFCRSAADQIAWFKTHVPVERGALPPVLDMEWNSTSPTCRKRPPKAEVHAAMREFLTEAERHYGKRPVIYTTVDFHRDVMDGAFTDYPVWVRSTAGHPSLRYGGRRWHFWQYTATGRVPGVSGNVDRNAFFGTAADWRKFVSAEN